MSKKHDKKVFIHLAWADTESNDAGQRLQLLMGTGAEAVSAEPQVTVLVSMVVFVFVVCHLVQ